MIGHDLDSARWRTSSFSGDQGSCVEIAPLPAGGLAVRDSKHRDGGAIRFTLSAAAAWLRGVSSDGFDARSQPT